MDNRYSRIFIVAIIILALVVSVAFVLFQKNIPKEPQVSIVDLLTKNAEIKIGNNTDTILVEFTDYACPFCARFWLETFPMIKRNYIDTGKITFIVRDYPIPQLHGVNPFYASMYVKCVYKYIPDNNLYIVLSNKLYQNRTWMHYDYENLSHYLLNLMTFNESIHNKIVDCYYYNDTSEEVYYDYQLGNELQLIGTPSFFLLSTKLNDTGIKEIKDELKKYGLDIKVISDTYNGKNYYVIYFIGALPYEAFDFILKRAT